MQNLLEKQLMTYLLIIQIEVLLVQCRLSGNSLLKQKLLEDNFQNLHINRNITIIMTQ